MKQSLCALTSLALLAACGDSATEVVDEQPTAVAALERSYGGIDTADESPQFADPSVQAEDAMDAEVPLGDDPSDDRAPIGAVIITLRYGDLANGRPSTATTADGAWRFRVAVDGGAFARGKVFAEPDETPNLTRLAPGVVTWTSTTPAGDHDGAKFAAVLGPDARGVTIVTAGADIAIPLRALDGHESVQRADAGLLYVRTYRVVRDGDGPDLCRGGTMRGRASGLNDDGVGRIAAVVRNHEGDTIGHLRGVYGVRDNGNQVFFAKLIGRGGEFMARARGVFERVDDGTIAVAARFHSQTGDAVGVIQGRIVDSNEERDGTAFLARWAYVCDDSMPRDRLPPESDRDERDRSAGD